MSNRGRDKFHKYKYLINFFSNIISVLPSKVRVKMLEFFRPTKGIKGIAIRYILLKAIVKHCGENVSIHPDVYLLSPKNLIIGDNVSVHPMCYIDATGGVEIGSDVSIAHSSSILSTEHNYNDYNTNIKDQGTINMYTIISNNVWIGSGARILGGSTIASGCIIGAGGVLKMNTEKNTIYGGVPAKKIKER